MCYSASMGLSGGVFCGALQGSSYQDLLHAYIYDIKYSVKCSCCAKTNMTKWLHCFQGGYLLVIMTSFREVTKETGLTVCCTMPGLTPYSSTGTVAAWGLGQLQAAPASPVAMDRAAVEGVPRRVAARTLPVTSPRGVLGQGPPLVQAERVQVPEGRTLSGVGAWGMGFRR